MKSFEEQCCARGRATINPAARQQRHHNYGNNWCVCVFIQTLRPQPVSNNGIIITVRAH